MKTVSRDLALRFFTLLLAITVIATGCDALTATPTLTPIANPTPTLANPAPATATSKSARPINTQSPAVSSPTPTATAPAEPSLELADLTANYSVELVQAHIEKLATEIGSRPAGSPGAQQAREYITHTLTSYGYEVTEQPFPFAYFEDMGSSINVVTPGPEQIVADSVSAPSQKEVKGELVAVGLGRSSDYVERQVEGKIVLIKRGEITFKEKVAYAQAAGAAGIIIYNNLPGPLSGITLGQTQQPAVTIAGQDGERLAGMLRQGPVEVELVVGATGGQRDAYNIIAGANNQQPIVILGAHFDSVPAGPGANDNASGAAMMLEIARLVAQTDAKGHFTFIAFGAEENGLLGSDYYVKALSPAELSQISAMVNLDMVGERAATSSSTEAHVEIRHGTSEEGRVEDMVAMAATMGIDARSVHARNDSDHAPFARVGVPVFHLTTGLDLYYHTSDDTANKIEPPALKISGTLAIALLQELVEGIR